MAGVQVPTLNASGIQPNRNSSKLTDLAAGSPLSRDNDFDTFMPRLRRHWLPHVSHALTAKLSWCCHVRVAFKGHVIPGHRLMGGYGPWSSLTTSPLFLTHGRFIEPCGAVTLRALSVSKDGRLLFAGPDSMFHYTANQ